MERSAWRNNSNSANNTNHVQVGRLLGFVCRVALGVAFVVSAVLKFISLGAFEAYIFSFDVIDLTTSSYIARLVLCGEMSVGLVLITTLYKKWSEWLAFALLLVFSLFLLCLMAKGDESNCHCMGEMVYLTPSHSLLKNLLLLICWWGARKSLTFDLPHPRIVLSAILLLSVVFAMLKLPMGLHSSVTRQFCSTCYEKFEEERKDLSAVRKAHRGVVCLFSVRCTFCKNAMRKLEVLLNRRRRQGEAPVVRWVVWGEENTLTDFVAETGVEKCPYLLTPPQEMLPISSFSVPMIVFFQDGEVVGTMTNKTFDDKKAEEFLK